VGAVLSAGAGLLALFQLCRRLRHLWPAASTATILRLSSSPHSVQ
jgi:hypothetical protein